MSRSTSRSRRRLVMLVHYHYRAPTGVEAGSFETPTPPALGSVIWILYDPGHPQHSVPH